MTTDKNQALVEAHGVHPESTPGERVTIGKAMLIALGASGPLSPKEMESFLAAATKYGADPSAIAEWKRFDYAGASLSEHFEGDARLARHLVYDAILICRAAGSPAQARTRAADAARALGVPPSIVGALGGIVEAEEALRKAQAALTVTLKGRTSGASASVTAGLEEIAEKQASLRRTRLSMMDEDRISK